MRQNAAVKSLAVTFLILTTGIAVLAGLFRVSSLSSDGLLSQAGYNLALTTHGALLLPFIGTVQVLVAAHLAEQVELPAWLSSLLRLTPWFMAVESVALAALMPATGFQFLTAGVVHFFNIAVAFVLAACAFYVRNSKPLSAAVILANSVAAAVFLGARGDLTYVALLLAVGFPGEPGRPSRVAQVTFVAASLLAFRALSSSLFLPLSLLWTALNSLLAVRTWRSDKADLLVKGGLAIFTFALLLRLLQHATGSSPADDLLSDTTVVVAAYHGEAFALVLLTLGLVFSIATPPQGRILALLQFTLIGSCATFCLLATRLGFLGMPRRYYAYLPEFTSLQQALSVSAWLVLFTFTILAGQLQRALRRRTALARDVSLKE